jgi:hypothetical protein
LGFEQPECIAAEKSSQASDEEEFIVRSSAAY